MRGLEVHVHALMLLLSVCLPKQCLRTAAAPTDSNCCVAVGIGGSDYSSHLLPRFVPTLSAYSATGGALSVGEPGVSQPDRSTPTAVTRPGP
jgi:hypothetical protein